MVDKVEKRGRPKKHEGETVVKTTAVIFERHMDAMNKLIREFRMITGENLDKADILRALLDRLEAKPPKLKGIKDLEGLRSRIIGK